MKAGLSRNWLHANEDSDKGSGDCLGDAFPSWFGIGRYLLPSPARQYTPILLHQARGLSRDTGMLLPVYPD